MHETRTLAQFVAQTQYTDLPARLIEDLKIVVRDTFGAGFVGTVQPWALQAVAMVQEFGGRPEASIINQRWRYPPNHSAKSSPLLPVAAPTRRFTL
jgi:2-methylcitrate dehydratase PrpD